MPMGRKFKPLTSFGEAVNISLGKDRKIKAEPYKGSKSAKREDMLKLFKSEYSASLRKRWEGTSYGRKIKRKIGLGPPANRATRKE